MTLPWSCLYRFVMPDAAELFDSQLFLLAEDNPDDAQLFVQAWAKANLPNPLLHVSDGMAALAYLQAQVPYEDPTKHPEPLAILLDLEMPLANGFEVLAWVRSQPAFNNLIVVAYTSSSRPEDAHRVYQLGGNLYLVKPTNFDELVTMLTSVHGWLRLVKWSRDKITGSGARTSLIRSETVP